MLIKIVNVLVVNYEGLQYGYKYVWRRLVTSLSHQFIMTSEIKCFTDKSAYMRGSRIFFQMGSNFEYVFCGERRYPNTAISGPSLTGQRNTK